MFLTGFTCVLNCFLRVLHGHERYSLPITRQVPQLIIARHLPLCFILSSIHSIYDSFVSGAQNDISGGQRKVVLRRYETSATSSLDAMERCSSSHTEFSSIFIDFDLCYLPLLQSQLADHMPSVLHFIARNSRWGKAYYILPCSPGSKGLLPEIVFCIIMQGNKSRELPSCEPCTI